MPASGQDVEVAPADAQPLAGDDPAEGRGQARHHLQIAVAARHDCLRGVFVEPVRFVEGAIRLRLERVGIEMEHERGQVFRLAHFERQPGPFGEPFRQPDMVGVAVRHDQPRDALPGERAGEQLRPRTATGAVVDAGVEDGHPVVVVDQVDVDVIQPERKRQASPADPGRDHNGFARSGCGLKRVVEVQIGRALGHMNPGLACRAAGLNPGRRLHARGLVLGRVQPRLRPRGRKPGLLASADGRMHRMDGRTARGRLAGPECRERSGCDAER